MPENSPFQRDVEKSKVVDKSFEKTGWSTLETTADNMSAVLKNAGVSGISVKQLFNHPGTTRGADGIHAIILLYKWRPDIDSRGGWNPSRTPSMFAEGPRRNAEEDDSGNPGDRIMFFNQTVSNASSTQALMATVLNIPEKNENDFNLGSDLVELKDFVKPLDPILRTTVLCGSDVVIQAHNNTAKEISEFRPHLTDLDSKAEETVVADEFWLYTIYLPDSQSHAVYELEGMGSGVKVAGVMDETDESWTNVIEFSIDERIGELRARDAPYRVYGIFDNAHASSPEPSDVSEEKPANPDTPHENGVSSPSDSRSKKRKTMTENARDGRENKRRKLNLSNEDSRFRIWDMSESDLSMHAHDYTPFLVEMMKLMASRGDVQQVLRDAVMAEEKAATGSEQQKSEVEEDDNADYTVEIEDEEEIEVEEDGLEDGQIEEGDGSSLHGDGGRHINVGDVYSDQSDDGLQPEEDRRELADGYRRHKGSNDRSMGDESRSESSGGTATDDD